jgi:hypothetical protein
VNETFGCTFSYVGNKRSWHFSYLIKAVLRFRALARGSGCARLDKFEPGHIELEGNIHVVITSLSDSHLGAMSYMQSDHRTIQLHRTPHSPQVFTNHSSNSAAARKSWRS